MTNYAALGEYTAYAEQTKNAAGRRYAYMNNLANELRKLAEKPEENANLSRLNESMSDIIAADREMRAALERTNQAAPLCNKPTVTLSDLVKF